MPSADVPTQSYRGFNSAMSNNSDSQQSASKSRRQQRGGRKKKSALATEEEQKFQPALKSANSQDENRESRNSAPKETKNVSTPLRSDTMSIDNSDTASIDSQQSSSRRRHRRGGRKTKSSICLPSVSESMAERGVVPSPEVQDWIDDDYAAETVRESRASSSSRRRYHKGEAGIRTGNGAVEAKSAERFGGDVRYLGSRSNANTEKGKGKKAKTEKTREQGNAEEGEKKKKGPSIRLDLNLELDIVLKAKIKGDITISFV